jgi:hypothetical protein
MTAFLIEIDRKPVAVEEESLETAQRRALEMAEGRRAVMVTIMMGGTIPHTACYWDYEICRWVFTHRPRSADPQPSKA